MVERVVAIDGPSASGKSSTAAAVAKRLGLVHVDSGSLYRALAWLGRSEGIGDPAAVVATATRLGLSLEPTGREMQLSLGGRVLDDELRTPAASSGASQLALDPALREWVNRVLRRAVARTGGAVLDGRDIGTVVFPGAQLKVFLTASPEARVMRRVLQRGSSLDPLLLAKEAAELADRDRRDTARPVAPLAQAPDAVLVDSTDLSLAEQVARIVALAEERGLLGA